jgi:hypothetical protein
VLFNSVAKAKQIPPVVGMTALRPDRFLFATLQAAAHRNDSAKTRQIPLCHAASRRAS